ncbi:MAG: hypothetical protein HY924_07600 [Elusimicrobia bacterium]|nr:hypothetical protein [Elusimicrobiota bacterium]
MKNVQALIVGILCLTAAGANAQSFERQLFNISRDASAMIGQSRRSISAHGAQLVAALAQAAWQRVTGPDSTCTFELPGAPRASQATTPANGARAAYTTYTYLAEDNDRAYVVQTAVFPSGVDISDPKANLQAGLNNSAKGMDGGKWISVTWKTHQGLVAVDAVGMRNGHELRTFSVMRGAQIFAMTYAGPEGTSRSDDADRFFSSLTVR